jgi:hypothetical protein
VASRETSARLAKQGDGWLSRELSVQRFVTEQEDGLLNREVGGYEGMDG